MSAPSKESGISSQIQRAAFKKWKGPTNYMEVQQRNHQASYVATEDFGGHVDVTLNIQGDGNVDVLLNASGRQEPPYASKSQSVLDMPTYAYQPEDLYKGHNKGGINSDAGSCRPQNFYLYFLELQRLNAIKDVQLNASSKCGSPKIPYEGGLSQLQLAAFEKWSKDVEMEQFAAKNFASLNLKDDDSMQPTMGTLKGDTNNVLEIEQLLSKVGF